MKKIGIFIAGFICGILSMVILAAIVTNRSSNLPSGMTLFDEKGDVISENSFKVFQVLDSGDALALELGEYSISTGLVVLFLNEESNAYYDDQVITVPAGKCVRQIGTYKYTTKNEIEKTVPVVVLRSK
ncbi:MAG: hypothetical protein NC344_00155 [Bacteroidales bacterium]|nr:hypothetical protein [Bacteroidales bacterium]MCM1146249.1 hypothetical protein [Bacteroidales bacterium]MCM1205313.1 hypothetical protein [Bacillota bacterium]MCM1509600.1 hypothetical protein [Clostridium sp.]